MTHTRDVHYVSNLSSQCQHITELSSLLIILSLLIMPWRGGVGGGGVYCSRSCPRYEGEINPVPVKQTATIFLFCFAVVYVQLVLRHDVR